LISCKISSANESIPYKLVSTNDSIAFFDDDIESLHDQETLMSQNDQYRLIFGGNLDVEVGGWNYVVSLEDAQETGSSTPYWISENIMPEICGDGSNSCISKLRLRLNQYGSLFIEPKINGEYWDLNNSVSLYDGSNEAGIFFLILDDGPKLFIENESQEMVHIFFQPTIQPTKEPTQIPTEKPTEIPTEFPSNIPTLEPTVGTRSPSITPTSNTGIPTETPSLSPSLTPTISPTNSPSITPSNSPTNMPSMSSISPTISPSNSPTNTPTKTPTDTPTNIPSETPSITPTDYPSNAPTIIPTLSPTDIPTVSPFVNISSISTTQIFMYGTNEPNSSDKSSNIMDTKTLLIIILGSLLIIAMLLLICLFIKFKTQRLVYNKKLQTLTTRVVYLERNSVISQSMNRAVTPIPHNIHEGGVIDQIFSESMLGIDKIESTNSIPNLNSGASNNKSNSNSNTGDDDAIQSIGDVNIEGNETKVFKDSAESYKVDGMKKLSFYIDNNGSNQL